MAGDGAGLTGLWLRGAKYAPEVPADASGEAPVLDQARRWLDVYFSGRDPGPTPPLHPEGTPFQRAVWRLLLDIPYGTTTTYGALAQRLAQARGVPYMSAQAVGGAVGRNPISILVPCHRVVGADGSLTGYAGGLSVKLQLLTLEGANVPPETERRNLP